MFFHWPIKHDLCWLSVDSRRVQFVLDKLGVEAPLATRYAGYPGASLSWQGVLFMKIKSSLCRWLREEFGNEKLRIWAIHFLYLLCGVPQVRRGSQE